jgi:hypothetical protein
MKKIYRVEHIKSQEQFKEKFEEGVPCLRILNSTSLKKFIIEIPEYCFSDRSNNYNIVVLTDEELNALKGLEAKTK